MNNRSADANEIYKKFVEAKAEHDFHHSKINNGYKEGSEGFMFYANKINHLYIKEMSKPKSLLRTSLKWH